MEIPNNPETWTLYLTETLLIVAANTDILAEVQLAQGSCYDAWFNREITGISFEIPDQSESYRIIGKL